MAFNLTDTEHKQLDSFIDAVIEAAQKGQVATSQARQAIVHVIAAAAMDNEFEVKDWLTPERLVRWKYACQKA